MITQVLKWSAATICILGSFVNAMGYQPAGPILFIIGGLLWLAVGIIWKEMSVVVTNVAIVAVTIIGMMIPKVMPIVQAYLG